MFFEGSTPDRPYSSPRAPTLDPAPAPPPPPVEWGPPAALWRRLVARAADMLAVLFVLFALVVLQVFWFMDSLSSRFDPEPWGRALVATILYTILWGIYEVVFTRWNKGQTPGKDWMNLRVVSVDSGETPSALQALVRYLPFGLARLVPPWWLGTILPGILTASWPLSTHRRGLHDYLARTVVISFDRNEHEANDPDGQELPDHRKVRQEIREKYGLLHHFGLDKLLKPPVAPERGSEKK